VNAMRGGAAHTKGYVVGDPKALIRDGLT
jgi:hypothetical protein